MNKPYIMIKLPTGDSLVAEECPSDEGQIAVGIMRDDVWIQDLAVIECSHDREGKYVEDKFNVYVYGNEYDENYTECFEVTRMPNDAL